MGEISVWNRQIGEEIELEATRGIVKEACQNIGDISTNILDISSIYHGNIRDFFESFYFYFILIFILFFNC